MFFVKLQRSCGCNEVLAQAARSKAKSRPALLFFACIAQAVPSPLTPVDTESSSPPANLALPHHPIPALHLSVLQPLPSQSHSLLGYPERWVFSRCCSSDPRCPKPCSKCMSARPGHGPQAAIHTTTSTHPPEPTAQAHAWKEASWRPRAGQGSFNRLIHLATLVQLGDRQGSMRFIQSIRATTFLPSSRGME